MREDFLHFCWRWRRFDATQLTTTDGQALEILHPGEPNPHAGPDFFNARIRLDGTLWAGNVELHLRASDWQNHGHSQDKAYDNVLLHVVLDEDQRLVRPNGTPLPCLVLRPRLPARLLETYWRLEHERRWIPCADLCAGVPDIVRLNWLDRLLVERLEAKTGSVAAILEATDNQYEVAFFRLLARAYGLKVNADPFEMLARNLPATLLAKHRNNLFQIEALIFGQAGLLEDAFEDPYPQSLAKEYRFLRHKYGLTALEGSQWKNLRLRPANFPTLRLAQFAALLHRSEHLFDEVLEARKTAELIPLLATGPSAYWQIHFQFDKPSGSPVPPPGRDFIEGLLINAVVPMLFHYGRMKQAVHYQDRALRLLEELPAESNALVSGWKNIGIAARTAAQSQALLHLKTHYCDARRCLECAFGNVLLR